MCSFRTHRWEAGKFHRYLADRAEGRTGTPLELKQLREFQEAEEPFKFTNRTDW